MKKLAVVLALLALAVATFGCGNDDGLPDDAAAQVGETVITKETVDARISEIQTQLPGQTPDAETDPEGFKQFQGQVVDYLVTLEIATQMADELGVTVTDEDIQEQVDLYLSGYFGGDQEAFDQALADQNMTLDQLKSSIRERELLNKTAEAATQDVTVSEEEIAAYYDEHAEDFAVPETRTTRHILIAPADPADAATSPTDEQWEEARVEAEAVLKRLQDGEDFATVAKEVSDDPGSSQQGGDLGDVAKGAMVPEFEDAVFSLKAGELSGLVKTQYGYHIIRVEQVNEASQGTLEESTDQIEATLLDEAKAAAWEKWLADTKVTLVVVVAPDYATTTTTTAAPATGETTSTTASQ